MTVEDDNQTSRDELNKSFFERNGQKFTAKHFDQVIAKAREIEDKVQTIPALHELWKDVLLCLELIRDYRAGTYRDIAGWAVVAVVFGLLYLIDPLELIPDFIPVVGYLDDVAILALILKLVHVELDKYAAWRKTCAKDEQIVASPSEQE